MMRIYAIKAFAPPFHHKSVVIYQKKISMDFLGVSVRFPFRYYSTMLVWGCRRWGEAEPPTAKAVEN